MLADLPIEFRHIFYLFCVVGPENEILRIETVREEIKETWNETNQQNSGKVTEEMVQGPISPHFLRAEFLLQNLEVYLWRADVASSFTPTNLFHFLSTILLVLTKLPVSNWCYQLQLHVATGMI